MRSIGGSFVGRIAGVAPVGDLAPGVESVDISLFLASGQDRENPSRRRKAGHQQYHTRAELIFRALGLGGDNTSDALLRALKQRRASIQVELQATQASIRALEARAVTMREKMNVGSSS